MRTKFYDSDDQQLYSLDETLIAKINSQLPSGYRAELRTRPSGVAIAQLRKNKTIGSIKLNRLKDITAEEEEEMLHQIGEQVLSIFEEKPDGERIERTFSYQSAMVDSIDPNTSEKVKVPMVMFNRKLMPPTVIVNDDQKGRNTLPLLDGKVDLGVNDVLRSSHDTTFDTIMEMVQPGVRRGSFSERFNEITAHMPEPTNLTFKGIRNLTSTSKLGYDRGAANLAASFVAFKKGNISRKTWEGMVDTHAMANAGYVEGATGSTHAVFRAGLITNPAEQDVVLAKSSAMVLQANVPGVSKWIPPTKENPRGMVQTALKVDRRLKPGKKPLTDEQERIKVEAQTAKRVQVRNRSDGFIPTNALPIQGEWNEDIQNYDTEGVLGFRSLGTVTKNADGTIVHYDKVGAGGAVGNTDLYKLRGGMGLADEPFKVEKGGIDLREFDIKAGRGDHIRSSGGTLANWGTDNEGEMHRVKYPRMGNRGGVRIEEWSISFGNSSDDARMIYDLLQSAAKAGTKDGTVPTLREIENLISNSESMNEGSHMHSARRIMEIEAAEEMTRLQVERKSSDKKIRESFFKDFTKKRKYYRDPEDKSKGIARSIEHLNESDRDLFEDELRSHLEKKYRIDRAAGTGGVQGRTAIIPTTEYVVSAESRKGGYEKAYYSHIVPDKNVNKFLVGEITRRWEAKNGKIDPNNRPDFMAMKASLTNKEVEEEILPEIEKRFGRDQQLASSVIQMLHTDRLKYAMFLDPKSGYQEMKRDEDRQKISNGILQIENALSEPGLSESQRKLLERERERAERKIQLVASKTYAAPRLPHEVTSVDELKNSPEYHLAVIKGFLAIGKNFTSRDRRTLLGHLGEDDEQDILRANQIAKMIHERFQKDYESDSPTVKHVQHEEDIYGWLHDTSKEGFETRAEIFNKILEMAPRYGGRITLPEIVDHYNIEPAGTTNTVNLPSAEQFRREAPALVQYANSGNTAAKRAINMLMPQMNKDIIDITEEDLQSEIIPSSIHAEQSQRFEALKKIYDRAAERNNVGKHAAMRIVRKGKDGKEQEIIVASPYAYKKLERADTGTTLTRLIEHLQNPAAIGVYNTTSEELLSIHRAAVQQYVNSDAGQKQMHNIAGEGGLQGTAFRYISSPLAQEGKIVVGKKDFAVLAESYGMNPNDLMKAMRAGQKFYHYVQRYPQARNSGAFYELDFRPDYLGAIAVPPEYNSQVAGDDDADLSNFIAGYRAITYKREGRIQTEFVALPGVPEAVANQGAPELTMLNRFASFHGLKKLNEKVQEARSVMKAYYEQEHSLTPEYQKQFERMYGKLDKDKDKNAYEAAQRIEVDKLVVKALVHGFNFVSKTNNRSFSVETIGAELAGKEQNVKKSMLDELVPYTPGEDPKSGADFVARALAVKPISIDPSVHSKAAAIESDRKREMGIYTFVHAVQNVAEQQAHMDALELAQNRLYGSNSLQELGHYLRSQNNYQAHGGEQALMNLDWIYQRALDMLEKPDSSKKMSKAFFTTDVASWEDLDARGEILENSLLAFVESDEVTAIATAATFARRGDVGHIMHIAESVDKLKDRIKKSSEEGKKLGEKEIRSSAEWKAILNGKDGKDSLRVTDSAFNVVMSGQAYINTVRGIDKGRYDDASEARRNIINLALARARQFFDSTPERRRDYEVVASQTREGDAAGLIAHAIRNSDLPEEANKITLEQHSRIAGVPLEVPAGASTKQEQFRQHSAGFIESVINGPGDFWRRELSNGLHNISLDQRVMSDFRRSLGSEEIMNRYGELESASRVAINARASSIAAIGAYDGNDQDYNIMFENDVYKSSALSSIMDSALLAMTGMSGSRNSNSLFLQGNRALTGGDIFEKELQSLFSDYAGDLEGEQYWMHMGGVQMRRKDDASNVNVSGTPDFLQVVDYEEDGKNKTKVVLYDAKATSLRNAIAKMGHVVPGMPNDTDPITEEDIENAVESPKIGTYSGQIATYQWMSEEFKAMKDKHIAAVFGRKTKDEKDAIEEEIASGRKTIDDYLDLDYTTDTDYAKLVKQFASNIERQHAGRNEDIADDPEAMKEFRAKARAMAMKTIGAIEQGNIEVGGVILKNNPDESRIDSPLVSSKKGGLNVSHMDDGNLLLVSPQAIPSSGKGSIQELVRSLPGKIASLSSSNAALSQLQFKMIGLRAARAQYMRFLGQYQDKEGNVSNDKYIPEDITPLFSELRASGSDLFSMDQSSVKDRNTLITSEMEAAAAEMTSVQMGSGHTASEIADLEYALRGYSRETNGAKIEYKKTGNSVLKGGTRPLMRYEDREGNEQVIDDLKLREMIIAASAMRESKGVRKLSGVQYKIGGKNMSRLQVTASSVRDLLNPAGEKDADRLLAQKKALRNLQAVDSELVDDSLMKIASAAKSSEELTKAFASSFSSGKMANGAEFENIEPATGISFHGNMTATIDEGTGAIFTRKSGRDTSTAGLTRHRPNPRIFAQKGAFGKMEQAIAQMAMAIMQIQKARETGVAIYDKNPITGKGFSEGPSMRDAMSGLDAAGIQRLVEKRMEEARAKNDAHKKNVDKYLKGLRQEMYFDPKEKGSSMETVDRWFSKKFIQKAFGVKGFATTPDHQSWYMADHLKPMYKIASALKAHGIKSGQFAKEDVDNEVLMALIMGHDLMKAKKTQFDVNRENADKEAKRAAEERGEVYTGELYDAEADKTPAMDLARKMGLTDAQVERVGRLLTQSDEVKKDSWWKTHSEKDLDAEVRIMSTADALSHYTGGKRGFLNIFSTITQAFKNRGQFDIKKLNEDNMKKVKKDSNKILMNLWGRSRKDVMSDTSFAYNPNTRETVVDGFASEIVAKILGLKYENLSDSHWRNRLAYRFGAKNAIDTSRGDFLSVNNAGETTEYKPKGKAYGGWLEANEPDIVGELDTEKVRSKKGGMWVTSSMDLFKEEVAFGGKKNKADASSDGKSETVGEFGQEIISPKEDGELYVSPTSAVKRKDSEQYKSQQRIRYGLGMGRAHGGVVDLTRGAVVGEVGDESIYASGDEERNSALNLEHSLASRYMDGVKGFFRFGKGTSRSEKMLGIIPDIPDMDRPSVVAHLASMSSDEERNEWSRKRFAHFKYKAAYDAMHSRVARGAIQTAIEKLGSALDPVKWYYHNGKDEEGNNVATSYAHPHWYWTKEFHKAGGYDNMPDSFREESSGHEYMLEKASDKSAYYGGPRIYLTKNEGANTVYGLATVFHETGHYMEHRDAGFDEDRIQRRVTGKDRMKSESIASLFAMKHLSEILPPKQNSLAQNALLSFMLTYEADAYRGVFDMGDNPAWAAPKTARAYGGKVDSRSGYVVGEVGRETLEDKGSGSFVQKNGAWLAVGGRPGLEVYDPDAPGGLRIKPMSHREALGFHGNLYGVDSEYGDPDFMLGPQEFQERTSAYKALLSQTPEDNPDWIRPAGYFRAWDPLRAVFGLGKDIGKGIASIGMLPVSGAVGLGIGAVNFARGIRVEDSKLPLRERLRRAALAGGAIAGAGALAYGAANISGDFLSSALTGGAIGLGIAGIGLGVRAGMALLGKEIHLPKFEFGGFRMPKWAGESLGRMFGKFEKGKFSFDIGDKIRRALYGDYFDVLKRTPGDASKGNASLISRARGVQEYNSEMHNNGAEPKFDRVGYLNSRFDEYRRLSGKEREQFMEGTLRRINDGVSVAGEGPFTQMDIEAYYRKYAYKNKQYGGLFGKVQVAAQDFGNFFTKIPGMVHSTLFGIPSEEDGRTNGGWVGALKQRASEIIDSSGAKVAFNRIMYGAEPSKEQVAAYEKVNQYLNEDKDSYINYERRQAAGMLEGGRGKSTTERVKEAWEAIKNFNMFRKEGITPDDLAGYVRHKEYMEDRTAGKMGGLVGMYQSAKENFSTFRNNLSVLGKNFAEEVRGLRNVPASIASGVKDLFSTEKISSGVSNFVSSAASLFRSAAEDGPSSVSEMLKFGSGAVSEFASRAASSVASAVVPAARRMWEGPDYKYGKESAQKGASAIENAKGVIADAFVPVSEKIDSLYKNKKRSKKRKRDIAALEKRRDTLGNILGIDRLEGQKHITEGDIDDLYKSLMEIDEFRNLGITREDLQGYFDVKGVEKRGGERFSLKKGFEELWKGKEVTAEENEYYQQNRVNASSSVPLFDPKRYDIGRRIAGRGGIRGGLMDARDFIKNKIWDGVDYKYGKESAQKGRKRVEEEMDKAYEAHKRAISDASVASRDPSGSSEPTQEAFDKYSPIMGINRLKDQKVVTQGDIEQLAEELKGLGLTEEDVQGYFDIEGVAARGGEGRKGIGRGIKRAAKRLSISARKAGRGISNAARDAWFGKEVAEEDIDYYTRDSANNPLSYSPFKNFERIKDPKSNDIKRRIEGRGGIRGRLLDIRDFSGKINEGINSWYDRTALSVRGSMERGVQRLLWGSNTVTDIGDRADRDIGPDELESIVSGRSPRSMSRADDKPRFGGILGTPYQMLQDFKSSMFADSKFMKFFTGSDIAKANAEKIGDGLENARKAVAQVFGSLVNAVGTNIGSMIKNVKDVFGAISGKESGTGLGNAILKARNSFGLKNEGDYRVDTEHNETNRAALNRVLGEKGTTWEDATPEQRDWAASVLFGKKSGKTPFPGGKPATDKPEEKPEEKKDDATLLADDDFSGDEDLDKIKKKEEDKKEEKKTDSPSGKKKSDEERLSGMKSGSDGGPPSGVDFSTIDQVIKAIFGDDPGGRFLGDPEAGPNGEIGGVGEKSFGSKLIKGFAAVQMLYGGGAGQASGGRGRNRRPGAKWRTDADARTMLFTDEYEESVDADGNKVPGGVRARQMVDEEGRLDLGWSDELITGLLRNKKLGTAEHQGIRALQSIQIRGGRATNEEFDQAMTFLEETMASAPNADDPEMKGLSDVMNAVKKIRATKMASSGRLSATGLSGKSHQQIMDDADAFNKTIQAGSGDPRLKTAVAGFTDALTNGTKTLKDLTDNLDGTVKTSKGAESAFKDLSENIAAMKKNLAIARGMGMGNTEEGRKLLDEMQAQILTSQGQLQKGSDLYEAVKEQHGEKKANQLLEKYSGSGMSFGRRLTRDPMVAMMSAHYVREIGFAAREIMGRSAVQAEGDNARATAERGMLARVAESVGTGYDAASRFNAARSNWNAGLNRDSGLLMGAISDQIGDRGMSLMRAVNQAGQPAAGVGTMLTTLMSAGMLPAMGAFPLGLIMAGVAGVSTFAHSKAASMDTEEMMISRYLQRTTGTATGRSIFSAIGTTMAPTKEADLAAAEANIDAGRKRIDHFENIKNDLMKKRSEMSDAKDGKSMERTSVLSVDWDNQEEVYKYFEKEYNAKRPVTESEKSEWDMKYGTIADAYKWEKSRDENAFRARQKQSDAEHAEKLASQGYEKIDDDIKNAERSIKNLGSVGYFDRIMKEKKKALYDAGAELSDEEINTMTEGFDFDYDALRTGKRITPLGMRLFRNSAMSPSSISMYKSYALSLGMTDESEQKSSLAFAQMYAGGKGERMDAMYRATANRVAAGESPDQTMEMARELAKTAGYNSFYSGASYFASKNVTGTYLTYAQMNDAAVNAQMVQPGNIALAMNQTYGSNFASVSKDVMTRYAMGADAYSTDVGQFVSSIAASEQGMIAQGKMSGKTPIDVQGILKNKGVAMKDAGNDLWWRSGNPMFAGVKKMVPESVSLAAWRSAEGLAMINADKHGSQRIEKVFGSTDEFNRMAAEDETGYIAYLGGGLATGDQMMISSGFAEAPEKIRNNMSQAGIWPTIDSSTGFQRGQMSMYGMTFRNAQGSMQVLKPPPITATAFQKSLFAGNVQMYQQQRAAVRFEKAGINPYAMAGASMQRTWAERAAGNVFFKLAPDGFSKIAIGGNEALAMGESYDQLKDSIASSGIQVNQLKKNREFELAFQRPLEDYQIKQQYASTFGGRVASPFAKLKNLRSYQNMSKEDREGINLEDPAVLDFGRGQMEYRRLEMGIQLRDMLANHSQNMTRMGWQFDDASRERGRTLARAGWQREDFGFQQQQMGMSRAMQSYNFAFEAREMGIGRQTYREDFAYGQRMKQMQFGWQMEDADINIRRSTGFERKQLIKQKERETVAFNAEKEQDEKLNKRQEDAFKRQQEKFEKEIAHYKASISLEDLQFKKSIERFEEQQNWETEDHNIRLGRLEQEKAWAQEGFDRQMERFNLEMEQFELQKKNEEVMAADRELIKEAERLHADEMYKLNLASANIAAASAIRMAGVNALIDDTSKDIEYAVKVLEKFYTSVQWEKVSTAMDKIVEMYKTINGETKNGRASGGPINSGKTWIVGELGPEMITVGDNGQPFVLPNSALPKNKSIGSGSGGEVIHIHVMMDSDEIATYTAGKANSMAARNRRRAFNG